MTDVSTRERTFPQGRIDRIYLHWSAGDYTTVYESYHYCVTFEDGHARVVQTNDLRANMRDVRANPAFPYAAHTAARNSYAAGLSVMGMKDARPDDFGPFPLMPQALDAMCALAAQLAEFYRIPIDADHVMTHAEAALIDGYYGTAEEERWDIARLRPSPQPLTPKDALEAGEELRRRIKELRT